MRRVGGEEAEIFVCLFAYSYLVICGGRRKGYYLPKGLSEEVGERGGM